jgi:hypothetical protein
MAAKRRSTKSKVRSIREARSGYSAAPAIDKKALREMLDAYKQVNIADEKARIRIARERTPSEAFAAFLDLWEFGKKYASHNPRQRQEKVKSMLQYYERIKGFEKWRRSRAG